MKKALYILLAIMTFASCKQKDLCYTHPHGSKLDVEVHWADESQRAKRGMRVVLSPVDHFSPLEPTDMASEGGIYDQFLPSDTYHGICYDYFESDVIEFNNEEWTIAYTNTIKRQSYSAIYPKEILIECPDRLYVGTAEDIKIDNVGDKTVHFYPTNRVETYTFEIRNVRGANFIKSFGGACSGISPAYYLYKGESLDTQPCTVVFGARADAANNKIVGEFRIFGHCPNARNPHFFTMEVRYPSTKVEGGYLNKTWEVSDQMHNGTHHLIMDWNIDIIPSGPESGFDADVAPWDEVWIPVEM